MRFPRRVCLTLLALAAPASAQCTPDWSDKFSHPDFERPAYATVVFDDGTGPALYAGGNFQEAGSAPASLVAKWSGYKWQPVGTGLGPAAGNYKYVTTLAVHDDDGPGPHPPALYASGNFTEPGPGIAKWDGSSWSTIGRGLVGAGLALGASASQGSPSLFVGGQFTAMDGQVAPGLAELRCELSCYPNCDGSTLAPILNVNDYICFQGEWRKRSAYGDYNGDGVWTINDFIAFQADFRKGCP